MTARVVVVSPGLRPNGGIERYTRSVSHALANRGHELAFVVPASHADHVPTGSRVETVAGGTWPSSWRGALELLTFQQRASRLLKRLTGFVPYGPLGASRAGVLTAHSVHAAAIRDRLRTASGQPAGPFDRALIRAERRSLDVSQSLVHAVSPRCADDLASMYGLNRADIKVIPPAVDLAEFRPPSPDERRAARRRYGLDEDDLAVGVVANHNFENKRVMNLIDAASDTGATLLVAGAGVHDRPQYDERIRSRGALVRFCGLIGEMAEFYWALDIVAMPSGYESYGMAAHEAMACGVASLVSDRTGLADLLQPGVNTLTVPLDDVAALGRAIQELQDEPSRHELATAGQRWAVQRSWADVAQQIEAEVARYINGERST